MRLQKDEEKGEYSPAIHFSIDNRVQRRTSANGVETYWFRCRCWCKKMERKKKENENMLSVVWGNLNSITKLLLLLHYKFSAVLNSRCKTAEYIHSKKREWKNILLIVFPFLSLQIIMVFRERERGLVQIYPLIPLAVFAGNSSLSPHRD